jgi:hypothetical protein
MKRVKCIAVALALLTVSACVTLPPPPGPQDSQSAAIGISLVVRPPLRLFGLADQKTDMTVYFIRLDDKDENPGSFLQTTVYRSNYTHGNQVYLLNATPGRYAAVIVFFERTPPPPPSAPGASPVASTPPKKVNYWTYFPEDVIRDTDVTVPPGTIRYMGDFVVDQAPLMKNADEAQDFYCGFVISSYDKMIKDLQKGMAKGLEGTVGTYLFYSIMNPASCSTVNLMARVMLFDEVHSAGSANSANRNPQAEATFLKKAGEQFQTTGWMPSIHKRLDELAVP